MEELTDINYWLANFTAAFSKMKQLIFSYVPQLVGALLIIVVGFFIAKFCRIVLNKIFRPADQFIQLIERKSGRQLFLRKWTISTFLASFFYWILLFYFVFVAVQVLHIPKLESWIKDLFLFLPGILTSLLIIIVGFVLGAYAYDYVLTAAKARDLENPTLIGQVVRISVILVFLIFGIDQLGFNIAVLTNALLVVLTMGLLGSAIGFGMGASSHVANMIASRDLRKYLNAGEQVTVGEQKGILIEITSTSVILESPLGRIKIPSKLANQLMIVIK